MSANDPYGNPMHGAWLAQRQAQNYADYQTDLLRRSYQMSEPAKVIIDVEPIRDEPETKVIEADHEQ